jgi:hypothetical protein
MISVLVNLKEHVGVMVIIYVPFANTLEQILSPIILSVRDY